MTSNGVSVHSPFRSVDANNSVVPSRKSAFGTQFINGSNSSLQQQQQQSYAPPSPHQQQQQQLSYHHYQHHQLQPPQLNKDDLVSKHDDIENQGHPNAAENEQTQTLSFELDAAFGQHQSTRWTVQLRDNMLFLQMATPQLMLVSKEAFVNLLEYAEEQLQCESVVIKLDKNRCEKTNSLIRMFMYLGFEMLPPSHNLVLSDSNDNALYMIYKIQ